MNVVTKMVAENDGNDWLELHWIAHDDNFAEYVLIRDAFWAWRPEQFDINIREIEVEYPGGYQTLLLGEFYGQKPKLLPTDTDLVTFE